MRVCWGKIIDEGLVWWEKFLDERILEGGLGLSENDCFRIKMEMGIRGNL